MRKDKRKYIILLVVFLVLMISLYIISNNVSVYYQGLIGELYKVDGFFCFIVLVWFIFIDAKLKDQEQFRKVRFNLIIFSVAAFIATIGHLIVYINENVLLS